MAIVLVRHGETPGNAARVLQMPDTPLSPRGVAQAERLADRLAVRAVSRIVSSDYARAQMTAAPLQAATGVALELDPDLRERNFGDLRGTAYADLEVDPFAPGYVPPRGESWEAMHARVDRVWARLTATAGSGTGRSRRRHPRTRMPLTGVAPPGAGRGGSGQGVREHVGHARGARAAVARAAAGLHRPSRCSDGPRHSHPIGAVARESAGDAVWQHRVAGPQRDRARGATRSASGLARDLLSSPASTPRRLSS